MMDWISSSNLRWLYMFQLLNRLFGGLIGGVLYPVKSLIINVVLISFAVLAAPLLWLTVPFGIFFSQEEDSNDDFVDLLVDMFILTPLKFIAIPFIAVGVLIGVCVTSVYDVIDSALQGFVDGVENGFFPYILDRLWSSDALFSTFARILNETFWNLPGSKPQIESYMSSSHFSELTQKEQLMAKDIAALTNDFERYNDLFNRLLSLDLALRLKGSDPSLPDVEDEVIPATEISQPSLLVKQYYDEALHSWRAVPAYTHIMDQANLFEWQKQCENQRKPFTHPLNRDDIDAAEGYNGQKTRYRIHPYQSMANAQELVELTSSIREHLAKAQTRSTLTKPQAPIVYDNPLNMHAPSIEAKPSSTDSVLTSGLH